MRVKPSALTCGYAVDGLGFFYIPFVHQQIQKVEAQAASVRVSDGTLSEAQIISELERLVSSKWNWEVVKAGPNLFRTFFPSHDDLAHMLEWGAVHTRYNAVMKIEEASGKSLAKSELKKVWVQFIGIPPDMLQFKLIWAVGSVLGVTKAVDMSFTNKYNVGCLQVCVLDPSIIPQFVDVVIGDFLYELQFRVEEKTLEDNPVPMDMDDYDSGENNANSSNNSAPDNHKGGAAPNVIGSASNIEGEPKNKDVNEKKVGLLGGQETEVLMDSEMEGSDLVPGSGAPDLSFGDGAVISKISSLLTPEGLALAAVPEAVVGSSVMKRSKRRAASSAGDSIVRASKLKAARNLDTAFSEGMVHSSSVTNFDHNEVLSNLQSLGFSFHNESVGLRKFVEFLVNNKNSGPSLQVSHDVFSRAIEKGERELLEEAELDKLMLSNLCSVVLEEVMDAHSEHEVFARTVKSHHKSKFGKNSVKLSSISK